MKLDIDEMMKLIKPTFALSLLIALLAACGGEPPEYLTTCVKSHKEMRPMFFLNGNGGMRMQIMPQVVCDERKTVKNPEYAAYMEKKGS